MKRIKNLAKREKALLGITAGVICAFLILQLLILPFFEKRSRLERAVRSQEEALREITLLSAEYKSLEKNTDKIKRILEGRSDAFSLFSYLDRTAGQADVKGHIKYMKPSVFKGSGSHEASAVEMELEGITLKQLVEYLYRVESSEKAVAVRRVSIRTDENASGSLDAILQVLTPQ